MDREFTPREKGMLLVSLRSPYEKNGLVRSIHVKDTQDKVQLTDSVRYREGMDEREIFHAFRDWVMRSNEAVLLEAVAMAGRIKFFHPVTPIAGNQRIFSENPSTSIMASQNRQVYAPHRVSWNRNASFTRGFLPAPKLKLITGWPP